MKITKARKFLAFALSFITVLSCTNGIFAYDKNIDTSQTEEIQSIAPCELRMESNDTTTLTFPLDGLSKTATDEEPRTIDLNGKIYPFVTGIYANKRIVGDFSSLSSEYLVESLVIEKNTENNVEASFVLANLADLSVQSVVASVSAEQFSQLLSQAQTNREDFLKENDEQQYNELLIRLDLGEDALAKAEASPENCESNVATVIQPMSSAYTHINDFSYYDLRNWINALKINERITFADYDISPSFFTTQGFQFSNKDQTLFGASKYTNYFNGAYYTTISVQDLVKTKISNTEVCYQMKISQAVMIEYIPGTDFVNLYMDNQGLKIKEVEMKIDNLRGNYNNIFIAMEKSGDVSSTSIDALSLIGLVDKLNYAATAIGAFERFDTAPFGSGRELFDDTVAKQVERYGKVIRGVAFDSGSVYIRREDQRMVLTGIHTAVSPASYDVWCSWTATTI